jgi:hypothetical protein
MPLAVFRARRTVLRPRLAMCTILHRNAPIPLEPLVADALRGAVTTKVW